MMWALSKVFWYCIFVKQARHVICYEPNPANRACLKENLALNAIENVQVRDVGLGSPAQKMSMVYNPLMPGGSSVSRKLLSLRHSAMPVLQEEIRITTLDLELSDPALPRPDFIKIDIEGWEAEALRRGRRHFGEVPASAVSGNAR